jgi:hypothetical protein
LPKLPEGQEIAAFVVSSSNLTEAASMLIAVRDSPRTSGRTNSFWSQTCPVMPTERSCGWSCASSLNKSVDQGLTARDFRS